jgi:serine/threonine protein kinase/Tfp pilus assembly protein PilF
MNSHTKFQTRSRWSAQSNGPEDRLSLALEEYIASRDAGQAIPRESIILKYSDIADELIGCLDSLEFVQNIAPQLTDERSGDARSFAANSNTTLGDFRLLRELGRGGMGVVYEAEQLSLGRHIALKVLPFAAMLDKQQLNRFKNEARAAATLDHPNIVAIYSVGAERGVHYYAMQLIEGRSLAEVIEQMRNDQASATSGDLSIPASSPRRGGPGRGGDAGTSSGSNIQHPASGIDTAAIANQPTLPVLRSALPAYSSREYFRAVARLGIQAAEALDHAHQNGILHRDIKPANLLLDDSSRLWITDFGLARVEQDSGMTMTGDLLGTLRYMSPEQALAKRVAVDHRSDIYSLGVTLYELLALRPAYTAADRQELLRQIAFEEPSLIRKLGRSIPLELDTIIGKAIAKNPAERYQSANALAIDLQAFLEDRPIKAKRATWREQAAKWCRRHVAIVWSAAAILMISTVVLVVANLRIAKWYHKAQESAENAERTAAERAAVIDFLVGDLLAAPKEGLKIDHDITVTEVLANAEKTVSAKLGDQPLAEAAVHDAIGETYSALSKYELAESHFRQALALDNKLLGPNHAYTLAATDSLVRILNVQEKFREARSLCNQALETTRQAFGDEHPKTLAAMKSLVRTLVLSAADLDHADAKYAEKFCQQTITLAGRIRGPEDLETIGTKYDLALFYLNRGDKEKAIATFEPMLEVCRNRFGEDNVLSLALIRLAGSTNEALGQFDKAAKQYEQALSAHRLAYGKKAKITLAVMDNLADVYDVLHKQNEARSLRKEAFVISRDAYGLKDPVTITFASELLSDKSSTDSDLNDYCDVIATVPQEFPPRNEHRARTALAWLFAATKWDNLRDGKRAVKLATEECNLLNYKDAAALDVLAVAYAETGDYQSAIQSCEKALASAAPFQREEILKHLDNFKKRKPWREEQDPSATKH